jgi:hypothetical protein
MPGIWNSALTLCHYSPLHLGGDAIQQVLLFPLSPTLFNAPNGQHECESNGPRTDHQWLRYCINFFLPIREEPYSPFNFVRVNERGVSDFGLSQGSRFNGTNCANRNHHHGPTNEYAHT